MKKMHKRKLSAADERLQNEIARRLKAGLPLAGLVAAALACGGCGNSHEQPPHVVGKMPAPTERRNVPEKRTPAPPPGKDNRANNVCPEVALGGYVAPVPANREREQKKSFALDGTPPPPPPPPQPNAKREKKQPPRLLGAPLPPEQQKP